MTLEHLSSIKGAQSSEAVERLFETIKNAAVLLDAEKTPLASGEVANIDQLRADIVMPSSEKERELIRANFPMSKNGYLMVAKVIEE